MLCIFAKSFNRKINEFEGFDLRYMEKAVKNSEEIFKFIAATIIVMTIKFWNRERELELLNRVEKPFLSIIYGRRRIGKTRLVLEFAKGKEHIYFFVNPKKSENLLLQEFSSLLGRKLGIPYVHPRNWDEFFELLFKYRGIVIFDEFQKFLEINPEVPFILQKYWDTHREKPTIILTGSVIGMVKKLFLESGSPLFKRAEIIIHLKELSPKSVFETLSELGVKDVEEKFRFYLLFGGVPYFYSLMLKYRIKDVNSAIRELVVDEFAPLRNEVEEVLIEAFKKEYSTYLSILYAIAGGKTKLSEIAGTAGIRVTSLPYYLKDLTDLLGIVERHRGLKMKSFYEISDRFYNFWCRFIYKYSSTENREELYKKILENLSTFFGWSFEKTVRENILSLFKNFQRAFKYYGCYRKSGKREAFDIDVVALNEKSKEILFAECKWKEKINARKVAKELAEKSQYVQWHNAERRESFAIFAKSFSKRINEFEGKKVYCFDLRDMKKLFEKRFK